MSTVTITQLHQDVLDVLRASPAGCTDDEVAAALGICKQTANGRRIWLHRRGLVCPVGLQDTGHRIKRTLWRATDG